MAARILIVLAALACAAVLLVPHVSGGQARTSASPCGAVALEPGEVGIERARQLTLCLLNRERARHGLAPLQPRAQLQLASQRHTDDMIVRHFFEHDAPDGTDPQRRMLIAGYPSNNAITGENIAWATGSAGTPAAIVDLWMHSPPHRENILRPQFTEIGVGIARGAPQTPRSDATPWTYTTDFGGPPIR
ncbi:MAG TPA: CAP domain-containing protein [Thermoleophilaceae bacterium]